MNLFLKFFHLTLWQPLFNLLVLFCVFLPGHNLGLAIIFLTLLIRILLYPLQTKATKSQLAIQAIQPKLKEIKKKFKGNREGEVKATLELYKEAKINPLSGILVMLIQFPVLIVLYRLFWQGINSENFVYLYSFVPRPEIINANFLGINLDAPSKLMAIIVGLVFFWQAKMTAPKKEKTKDKDPKSAFAQTFQKQMLYFFPAFMAFILFGLPSALSLYLLVSGLATAIQQYFIKKKYHLEEKQNV